MANAVYVNFNMSPTQALAIHRLLVAPEADLTTLHVALVYPPDFGASGPIVVSALVRNEVGKGGVILPPLDAAPYEPETPAVETVEPPMTTFVVESAQQFLSAAWHFITSSPPGGRALALGQAFLTRHGKLQTDVTLQLSAFGGSTVNEGVHAWEHVDTEKPIKRKAYRQIGRAIKLYVLSCPGFMPNSVEGHHLAGYTIQNMIPVGSRP